MPDTEGKKIEKTPDAGAIHISEDVIVELAGKTVQGIPNIKTAAKFAPKFGRGKKNGGIRVEVNHSQGEISVDIYVLVKYGQRIPDLAWDVQEKIKDNLERYTGYTVKAVNVNVQGIYTSPEDDFRLQTDPEEISAYEEAD